MPQPGSRRRTASASPADASSLRFPGPSLIGWALDLRFDLVDAQAQRVVVHQLQDIGVDPRALVMDLKDNDDTAELLAELRAARPDAQWRGIEPYYHRLLETFDALTTTMARQKADLPAEVRDLFLEFIDALSRPARELDLHAADESPARPAARATARRARPDSLTTRIKPMQAPADRSLSAIRQRFMPHVRRTVAARIQAALRAREQVRPPNPTGHVDTPQQVSRRLNRPTYVLTAAFVRAFYPWLGADTTAEHVRKSL